jgi:hypothetical protein
MCGPDQLDLPDGSEPAAVPGEPDDELAPYRPALTDEEREELRREWLVAVRPSGPADTEKPDLDGSRHFALRVAIRR